jgi:hypothetical protein
LLNANSEIVQLYHGENKLIFNEMMMRSNVVFIDEYLCFDNYDNKVRHTVSGKTLYNTDYANKVKYTLSGKTLYNTDYANKVRHTVSGKTLYNTDYVSRVLPETFCLTLLS